MHQSIYYVHQHVNAEATAVHERPARLAHVRQAETDCFADAEGLEVVAAEHPDEAQPAS